MPDCLVSEGRWALFMQDAVKNHVTATRQPEIWGSTPNIRDTNTKLVRPNWKKEGIASRKHMGRSKNKHSLQSSLV